MKKLKINFNDHQLFQTELDGESYHFLQIHKDAFKRMFETQGQSFWLQYLTTFRSSILKFHSIRPKTDKPNFAWQVFDEVCITLHEKFVEGRFSLAKQFCTDVAKVAEKADMFSSILSDSIVQNPFFCVQTREPFRNVFGEPDSGLYITSKVILQIPVFLKFIGSISELLRRWLRNDSSDQSDDYWAIPEEMLQDDYKPFFYEFYLMTFWGDKLQLAFATKVEIPWIKNMKFRRYPPSLEDLADIFHNSSFEKPSMSKKKKRKSKKVARAFATANKSTSKSDPINKVENVSKVVTTKKEPIKDESTKKADTTNTEKIEVKSQKKDKEERKVKDKPKDKKSSEEPLKKDKGEKFTFSAGYLGFCAQKAELDAEALKKLDELEKCHDEKSFVEEFLVRLADMHRLQTYDFLPVDCLNDDDSSSELPEKDAIEKTAKEKNLKKTAKEKDLGKTAKEKDLGKTAKEKDIEKTAEEKDLEKTAEEKDLEKTAKEKDCAEKPESSKSSKSLHLKTCAYCHKKEEKPKAFKKCKRCIDENFPHPRYYCGKECQVEDWQETHRDEHLRTMKKSANERKPTK